jgi:hypothetical protein
MRQLVLVAALAGSAHAERRMFAHAFEYDTNAPGETTLGLQHTEKRSSWRGSAVHVLEHVLVVDHGLTDHWDAGVRLDFVQTVVPDPGVDRAFGLDKVAMQHRYRFGDRGERPIADAQLQLLAAKEFGTSAYEIEFRGVLSRDFDKLGVAVNLAGLGAFGKRVANDIAFVWAGGVTYELHPKLNVGVESFGTTQEVAIGPTFAVGPSPNLWLAGNAGFGLVDAAPSLTARVILGIELR